MIKLITKKKEQLKEITKRMCEMSPLEVCVIVDLNTVSQGHVVMRTASEQLEVIDITNPRASNCWKGDNMPLKVRELYPGEKYMLELY